MKRCYLTEYYDGTHQYGSEVWANSWDHARRILKARGLGEKIMGAGPLLRAPSASKVLNSRKTSVPEKLHALVWLSYLALSSGKATVSEVLGDRTGILHGLAHLAIGLTKKDSPGVMSRAELVRHVRAIEHRIPGYSDPNYMGSSLWSLRKKSPLYSMSRLKGRR